MSSTSTTIARPRRVASVAADYRVRYNERAQEERERARQERKRRSDEEKVSSKPKKKRMTVNHSEQPPSPPISESAPSVGESDEELKVTGKRAPAQKQAQVQPLERQLPEPALSLELWGLILNDLYPSQLTKLAKVSPAFHNIVNWLSIWRHVCEASGIGQPLSRGRKSTYYKLALFESSRICEKCFTRCKTHGSGAALPVPIDGCNINLCQACRCAYYLKHPEPAIDIPKKQIVDRHGERQRFRVSKGHAMEQFKLGEGDLSILTYVLKRNPHYVSAAPMRLYDEKEVHLLARQVHGGEVGIEAMRDRTQKVRETRRINQEQRAEVLRQQREARRLDLETRFAELGLDPKLITWHVHFYFNDESITLESCINIARERQGRRDGLRQAMSPQGYELDEKSQIAKNFIEQEDRPLANAVSKLIAEIKLKRLREQRRAELSNALEQHGLDLKANSTLCQSYISSGTGSVDDIVRVLLELDWFMRETTMSKRNEAHDWTFAQDNFGVDRPFGKWQSMNNYLAQRLENGVWQNIEQGEDTPARPPPSLWGRIRQMMPDVWKRQADKNILAAYVYDEGRLAATLREDPDIYLETITDDSLVKAMDDGVLALRKAAKSSDATAETSELPIKSFSSSMQEDVGQEKFEAYFKSARKTLGDGLMSKYINKFGMHLPAAMQQFYDGCRVDATLTDERYTEASEAFIRDKIPEIATETHVHPTYLVGLFNAIKNPIGYHRRP